MASCVTFEYIRKNPDIRTYIQRADEALKSIGYTEHSFPHVEKQLLPQLEFSPNWATQNGKLNSLALPAFCTTLETSSIVLTTPRAVLLWHSDCSTGWKCPLMKSVL